MDIQNDEDIKMYFYENRLKTFEGWPFDEDCACNVENVSVYAACDLDKRARLARRLASSRIHFSSGDSTVLKNTNLIIFGRRFNSTL